MVVVVVDRLHWSEERHAGGSGGSDETDETRRDGDDA